MRQEIENLGGIKMIYIDPPFDIQADFSYDMQIGGGSFTKRPNILEQFAYADTWGRGPDSFLCMIYERLRLLRDLLADNGSIFVHCDYRLSGKMRLVLDDFDLFVREDLGGGRRGEPIQIRGWAGVMTKTMSGDLKYGFHTFRKNQLIEMYHNDGYRANPSGLWTYPAPHAELARLFGHIHLDMVPPNFHKKGCLCLTLCLYITERSTSASILCSLL